MNIQIFGTKKCNDTKKAERFFKERGIKYQFIDMKEKGMSKGEFTSVAQANGGPVSLESYGVMGITETVRVNPVIVTETIETIDEAEMTFNRYFVKTDSVFEFQTNYKFTSQEYPIDSGRMAKVVTNTEQFERIDELEVSENG